MGMHPREGWQADGTPPQGGLSRRGFLKQSAGAGLMMGSLGALLEACGSSSGPTPAGSTPLTSGGIPLPRPNNPVTWPIFKDNHAIASGLAPEQGATLKIYNWVAYLNPKIMKDFGKKYNCKVELTPFYDGKWRYTVPYTIYTTGIAWRKDKVPENPYQMANPWAMPWQGKYKGKVAILDDSRESISLGLMKNGIFNLNTTNASQIAAAGKALQDLAHLTNMHINNNDYTEIPSGQIWIHHAWSGDIAAAQYYMPKGVPVDVVGYWFPTDGKGPVGNDLISVLRSASNPVLAHHFMNYILDLQNALTNISWNGYMQPLNEVTPQRLVTEKLLPRSLMSTAVLPSFFRRGVMELQLPVTALSQWDQAWLQAKNA